MMNWRCKLTVLGLVLFLIGCSGYQVKNKSDLSVLGGYLPDDARIEYYKVETGDIGEAYVDVEKGILYALRYKGIMKRPYLENLVTGDEVHSEDATQSSGKLREAFSGDNYSCWQGGKSYTCYMSEDVMYVDVRDKGYYEIARYPGSRQDTAFLGVMGKKLDGTNLNRELKLLKAVKFSKLDDSNYYKALGAKPTELVFEAALKKQRFIEIAKWSFSAASGDYKKFAGYINKAMKAGNEKLANYIFDIKNKEIIATDDLKAREDFYLSIKNYTTEVYATIIEYYRANQTVPGMLAAHSMSASDGDFLSALTIARDNGSLAEVVDYVHESSSEVSVELSNLLVMALREAGDYASYMNAYSLTVDLSDLAFALKAAKTESSLEVAEQEVYGRFGSKAEIKEVIAAAYRESGDFASYMKAYELVGTKGDIANAFKAAQDNSQKAQVEFELIKKMGVSNVFKAFGEMKNASVSAKRDDKNYWVANEMSSYRNVAVNYGVVPRINSKLPLQYGGYLVTIEVALDAKYSVNGKGLLSSSGDTTEKLRKTVTLKLTKENGWSGEGKVTFHKILEARRWKALLFFGGDIWLSGIDGKFEIKGISLL